ncbi:MAG: hypothetical protein JNM99_15575 [Verrucomicrobiaceae bacterium]|nr:hypothetical protein [Verrucomicrobiaceae bacterium]
MSGRTELTLPPVLEAKLAAFRRRVWVIKLAEGVLAAVFGLALSYVIVFVLDRFMETPAWLRGALMLAGAAVLGLGLPLKWHRWVWQQRRLEDAARLLRRTFPRLGDQLLGIVELTKMEALGHSERLVQAAMNQAAEQVKDVSFDDAVPEDKHRRWAWIAGSVGAVALAAFVVVPSAAWNALARWITPWREVERYTFAKVEPLPKKLVVPYAEPVDVKATLAKNTEWSPESGRVQVKDQPALKSKLDSGNYDFKLPPQKKDAPMSVSIGDVRKSIELIPTQRPELKTLQAKLTLPDYLQYKTEPVIEARSGMVSVLTGAKTSFVLTASRALAKATMDGTVQPLVSGVVQTTPTVVEKSAEHRFEWADEHGLQAREPLLLKVNVVEDTAPRVLARRDEQEQVVLEGETVTIDLEASDDFGIKRAGLEWKGVPGESGPKPAQGESIATAGEPEKKDITVKATFNAQRDGVAPQTIELRGWAEDYKPGRDRARSPAFVLHIMTKDDHALWMTENMSKWLQAARETYEHEQRLHETNRELRDMKAEELDRPENRRKIAQQAAAESANADRLDRLNNAGRKMIEQAARNDSFEAQKLEQWASMVKALKDIAGKKMPSVADLLKKSAGAEASKGSPSSPSEKQDQQQANATPSKSQPNAPKVESGEKDQASGKAKPQDPNAPTKPQAPSVADREKSFFDKPKEDDAKKDEPGKPGSSKLGLPGTQLGAAPAKPDEKKQEEAKADSPAKQQLDKAIDEQKELLAAFAKVTDQLKDLLASLEGSTFVKRLKAASRRQMAIANSLNSETLSAFGLDKKKVAEMIAKKATDVATQQAEESSVVRVIQTDLEAYYQRKQDMRFKNILDQMKKTEIAAALVRVGDEAKSNWSGRSISASEYWADTLDRWAEEMVAAAKAGDGKGESKPQESLPPEIVLKVMQVLFDEMKLRDETREAENAKPVLEKKDYLRRAINLAERQDDIGRRTYQAAAEISKLPKAQSFQKEMKLLMKATEVMKEAYQMLDKPDTGAAVVAAETEVIEMLLEARRPPPGGGGGGGNNPGGGGSGSATSAALAELGPGMDPTANVQERETGQSTGKAGREFPEEFKAGLDAYFNALEAGEKK